eukprot:TRINITY_DN19453_c0_g1_i1.p1 TRINITY_DN19453_c0_g1~~TRINITY_DN19453_c0_g1_i1.p1  ORF type:complete len:134 (-),score=34.64 TRINITY_DN19453_c0_g1_i1:671-1072(-)
MAGPPPPGIENFLASLEDYVPTIPDELTAHYLARSGFQSPDIRLTRLVSVAAQKFIDEIAKDALHYAKIRHTAASKERKDKQQSSGKERRLVLTTEDLAAALKEYGVNIKRQEYFADSPAVGAAVSGKEKAQK